VDLRRLRLEEWVAAVCGVALLVVLFLDWFSAGSRGQSAWEAFAALDVVLAVVGLMAVALAVVAAAHRSQAVPLALGSLLVLIGVIGTAWLAIDAVSPPDLGPGTSREAGLWLGLAACGAVTLAALASIRDDRFPRAVVEGSRIDVPTLPAPPREGAGEAGS
jgi:carbon starvation protein CstA